MKRNSADAIDVAADRKDPMPGVIHALSEIGLGLKSVWRFLQANPHIAPVASRAMRKGRS
jgi:hypothetical protein